MVVKVKFRDLKDFFGGTFSALEEGNFWSCLRGFWFEEFIGASGW